MGRVWIACAVAASVAGSSYAVARISGDDATEQRSAPSEVINTVEPVAEPPATSDSNSGEAQAILAGDEDARALFTDIRACFRDDRRDQMDLFDQAADCYEPLVNSAAETIAPRSLLRAVEALLAERGDVFTACHNGGHSAAAIFTERFLDVTATRDVQLEQMRTIMTGVTGLCANGYWHGFYDAIGGANPPMTSFQAAATFCEELHAQNDTSINIDCGHGVGHSAWLSTKDFAAAAEICGVFAVDHLRYSCDDGVIMYLPDVWSEEWFGDGRWAANTMSDSWDVDRFYAAAAGVCDWWPDQRAGDPQPRAGCWKGIVGGVLFRPMTNLIDSTSRDYWGVRDQLADMLLRSEAICASFGPEGADVCFAEWPSFILYLTANDETQVTDLCSALPERAAWCIESTLKQIAYNAATGAEISVLAGS